MKEKIKLVIKAILPSSLAYNHINVELLDH